MPLKDRLVRRKGITTTTSAPPTVSDTSYCSPCPSMIVSPYRPEHNSEFGAKYRGHIQTGRRTDREELVALVHHAFTVHPYIDPQHHLHPPPAMSSSSPSSSSASLRHHNVPLPPTALRRMSSPLLPSNLVHTHLTHSILANSDGSNYAARLLARSGGHDDGIPPLVDGRGCITLRPKRPRPVDDINDDTVGDVSKLDVVGETPPC